MIIIPELSPSRLKLTAFSYKIDEINILSAFLNEKEIAYTSRSIPKSNDRIGMEFLIVGIRYIQRFQNSLFVVLRGKDKDVQVDFLQAEDGAPFCCKKIAQNPWEEENETIYANGDHEALIKCSLMANSRNWLGGISERGACRRD
jgi:hypothetical protein